MNSNISRGEQSGSDLVSTFVSRNIDVASERLTSIYGANTSIDYFGDKDAFVGGVAKTGSSSVRRNDEFP
jgi:hypothetical protein